MKVNRSLTKKELEHLAAYFSDLTTEQTRGFRMSVANQMGDQMVVSADQSFSDGHIVVGISLE